ncbi:hypothetical protein ACS0TY_029334 [Phlomoides rotata]
MVFVCNICFDMQVEGFGSFKTGLYLPSNDIDVIAKVRVPIINFVEKKSDVAFDLRIINNVNLEHSYDGLFWTLRGYDFSKSCFGPRTVILCDQCEKEYHVGCLKNCKLADLKKLPKGKWLCSTSCKWIYSALQNLLNAVLM